MAKQSLVLLLVLSLILTACRGSNSGGVVSDDLGPASALTLDQADQVAETFLQAWGKADYATMYNLISPNARDAYSQEEFTDAYTNTAATMSLETLDAQIKNSLRQGTTAAILYDVTFHTTIFGDITDPDRTLRLVETPEGWRIAWSTMDIFAELVEGARLDVIKSPAGRGNIYDRNGQVMADQNGRVVQLYLVEQDVADIPACIELLSRLLVREYKEIEATLSLYDDATRFFIGDLDPDTFSAESANLLQLCAIGDDDLDTQTRTTRRYYGDLAPHVIGYVSQIQPNQVEEYAKRGYPPDALVGQAGIEQSYEEVLAGQIGARLTITAPTGEELRVIAEKPAQAGQSVYLTIDRDLQYAVQNALVEAYNMAQPTWAPTSPGAAAVVMDVHTGEILAMASYPPYTTSLFHPDSPAWDRVAEIQRLNQDWRRPLLNRVTQGLYPAGSVFKIVSLTAALDSGVFTPEQTVYCSGRWSHPEDGVPVRTDWKPDGHGPGINAHWGLTYSCDPYFWEIGVALHKADPMLLPQYANMMGLGVSTGLTDLPEETGSILNPENYFAQTGLSWSLGTTLNFVIGQGEVQITPLQIVRMVAAVANGGILYKPLLVSRIQTIGEQPSMVAQPTPLATLDVDPQVFQIIQDAMCDVTLSPNGTARFVYEEWYNFQGMDVIVCGKTGTAQTGGAGVKPQAWFAAFTKRANQPEIAIVVIVENSCEGSEVAAPIVRRIVEDYYGKPHSEWPPLWQSGCYNLGE